MQMKYNGIHFYQRGTNPKLGRTKHGWGGSDTHTPSHLFTGGADCAATLVQFNSQFSSVQSLIMSDSLRPHESPRVHSNSRPSSRWCHPAISSSVVPFSSCPQSLPESKSFPMSQLFAWGGQSTGVSALASFLPKKSSGWSPSEWTGWISLQSKGLSRVFCNTTVQKH